jgi:hypothetical protein
MSYELAAMLGWIDRVRPVDGHAGVIDLTEAELLAFDGAAHLDWGEPDARGFYSPTLYSKVPEPLP